MPGVPAFILRRLYVKSSLQNTTDWWQFILRNTLGSGHAIGLVPLVLDETEEIPMADTTFDKDGVTTSFEQVDSENTFGLQMNREVTVRVSGEQLLTGEHRIDFGCIVPGLGQLGFDFTDEITNR